ncbi:alcohol oxidase-like protein [Xylariales sp. PMI_506]|nr:alcohol oxidase-like protein [Xylariales sp. PMI_506]
MGLYNKLADDITEVDVIVAGGGTAGCIVASRLAEADPNLSILVIEGGPDNYNDPSVVNPAFFLQHLLPTSKTALFYKANKAEQLAGREAIVPSGGMLGGGSSINFMMYTRAQRSDFDSWRTPGWSADEMIPYLNKLETYHGPGSKELHGHDGPIHISDSTFRSTRSESDFIDAATKVGWPEIEDLQDLDSNNGVQRWLRYVSPDGKRQDTAHRYLHPKLQDGQHPNLHVVVESQVHRVLFDGKKAVGVEYRPNPGFQASVNLTQSPIRSVKARKMVIVSCGACGTPPVLERSGIGNPEILKRANVPVVEDLPGVGDGYEDHNLILYPYRTSLEPHETIDAILSGRSNPETLVANNDKILGWNAIDISSKLRPTEEEVTALGPEFRNAWDRDFKEAPNRPLMLMGLVSCFLGDPASVPTGQYLSVGNYTAYPYSRGHMHITGAGLDDPLDFDVGFLTDEHDLDLKKQIWAYKKSREIMRRMDTYRGELALGHPRFPAGSKAACVETESSLGSTVQDIEYTAEDDAAIEQWVRENVNTTWHSIGTCKMAPRECKGVVDENLSVYGVEGLKLADLSIPPQNVAANTNNTALAVGERAAAIFIKELGLAA